MGMSGAPGNFGSSASAQLQYAMSMFRILTAQAQALYKVQASKVSVASTSRTVHLHEGGSST